MADLHKGPGSLGRPATRVWWVTEDENDDGEGIPVWFCHFANDGSDDRCRFDTDPIILVIAPSRDMGEEWLPEGFLAVCKRHAVEGIAAVEDAVERYVDGLAEADEIAETLPEVRLFGDAAGWPRWTVFVAAETVEKGRAASSVIEVRNLVARHEAMAHDLARAQAVSRLRQTCDRVTVTRTWTGEPTPGI